MPEFIRRQRSLPIILAAEASANIDLNFTGMADGALPAPLSGATWAIFSGKATNAPTLGAELLTDPSLEAGYSTDGLCATLTKAGSPTLAESTDTHAGSKAQQYTGTINSDGVSFAGVGSLTGKWLQLSGWGKRTAGTSNKTFFQKAQNGFPSGFAAPRAWKDAAYTQKIMVYKAYAANISVLAATNGAAPFDTVIVDDFSLKEITGAEMYATTPWTSVNATARIYIDQTNNNGTVGIVARLDSASNPQNSILVGLVTYADSGGNLASYLSMAKVVTGTLTVLINPTTLGAVAVNGDYIEVVCSGDSISMYYNGVQKGTTQTVSGLTGTLFGFFGAGGGLVNRFLLGAAV